MSERDLVIPENGYTLRRHPSGSWWIRYKQNGKMQDGSLGTADREEAERRAKVLFCKPSSVEKPIWWLPPEGARVQAFEVGRTTNGVQVRRVAETATFITAPHRVAPRELASGEDYKFTAVSTVDDPTDPKTRLTDSAAAPPSPLFQVRKRVNGGVYDVFFRLGEWHYCRSTGETDHVAAMKVAEKIHAEAFMADEHLDTKLIRQGGGWSTFRRDGEWWAERIDGGRRASLCLSTGDDEVAGQRFAALQNEFRDTPFDELLTATFAMRIEWVRASGYRWQPVHEDGTVSPASPKESL